MQAGKLRKRVVIQTSAVTADSFGEPTATWTSAATVWASVEPLNGRELLRAQEVNAEVTVRVTMRYNTYASQTARLLVGGSRLLDINSLINHEERNEELELLCSETK